MSSKLEQMKSASKSNLEEAMNTPQQESATAMQLPKRLTSEHENSHSKNAVAYIKTLFENKWLTSG